MSKAMTLAAIDAEIERYTRKLQEGCYLGMETGAGLRTDGPGGQTNGASDADGKLPFPKVKSLRSGNAGREAKFMGPAASAPASSAAPSAGPNASEVKAAQKAVVDDIIKNKLTRVDTDDKGNVVPYVGEGYYAVIGGYYVPVMYINQADGNAHARILEFKPFKEWCEQMDPRLTVTEVTIQSCDFGPKGLLFIKFKATIFDSAYKSIPSVVFMRGGSVAMLLVFSIEGEDNKKYTIMTRQARTPVGIARFFEIPAGMIDASNNFGGVAATEIKEELGLTIPQADLFDLTDFVYQKTQRGVYPSAGGCDEFIRVFLYEKTLTRDEYERMRVDMEARITGNEDEGERIKLKMVELDKLIFHAPDMKALSAVAMYAEFDRQRQVFLKAHGTDNQMVANGLNLEFQRRHRQGELVARDFGAE